MVRRRQWGTRQYFTAANRRVGTFRLAFIGNIQPIKGFMYGLQVLAGLPHAELDVVGGFSSEAYQHEIHDRDRSFGVNETGSFFHGSQPPETAWDP